MKSTLRALAVLLGAAEPAFVFAEPVPLSIDAAQSRVEIVVKATVDSFTGKLDAYKAAISVDDGRVVSARLDFRFSDVRTGKPARDEAMHEWQETARHPDASFVLAALKPAAEGRLTATGALTLHGVTKEISFPVSVIRDGDRYAFDGEATLDTRDHGLPVIRKFLMLKVDPSVVVRFHLQGSPKAP